MAATINANIKFVVTLTRYISDGRDYSSFEDVEFYSRPLFFSSFEEILKWMDTYHYERDKYRPFVFHKKGKARGEDTRYFATVHIPTNNRNGIWNEMTSVGHLE